MLSKNDMFVHAHKSTTKPEVHTHSRKKVKQDKSKVWENTKDMEYAKDIRR